MLEIKGLTSNQVEERLLSGQNNNVMVKSSRSVRDFVRKNAFSPVNIVMHVIGLGMILVADFKSAIVTVLAVIINVIIGIMQETRVKHKLDPIALLTRAKPSILWCGQEQEVDPSELVLGDVLLLRAGDQIPADGLVVRNSKIEVDESAITGERTWFLKSRVILYSLVLFASRGKPCLRLPALVLAVVASAVRQRDNLMKHVSQFSITTSFTIFLFGILIYISAYFAIGQGVAQVDIPQSAMMRIGKIISRDYSQLIADQMQVVNRVTAAHTALTTYIVVVSVLLLVFAQPPLHKLADCSENNGGMLSPTIVAAILVLGYGLIFKFPQTNSYFDLAPLPASLLLVIVMKTLLWAVNQLEAWRSHFLITSWMFN